MSNNENNSLNFSSFDDDSIKEIINSDNAYQKKTAFKVGDIFKNKKSVICDLDNTLWGGIIGDDGVEGIAIGNEQPAGMSYTEFQSYLKKLTGLGIMLNVCSKNEEAIAKQGFTHS